MISTPSRPRFELIIGTATAAERRLVTADTVRTLTGITISDAPDATLELMIDMVLAQCARHCKLQRAGTAPPTFARETVRATWPATAWDYDTRYWSGYGGGAQRFTSLVLPWRVPISTIGITEGGVTLVEGTDFVLQGAALVERLSGVWPTGGELVVDYTAGWLAPSDASYDEGDTIPLDLLAAIVEQVRLTHSQRSIDPALRSEDIPGVWSGAYNVPGGDAISSDGLTAVLCAALMPFYNPSGMA